MIFRGDVPHDVVIEKPAETLSAANAAGESPSERMRSVSFIRDALWFR